MVAFKRHGEDGFEWVTAREIGVNPVFLSPYRDFLRRSDTYILRLRFGRQGDRVYGISPEMFEAIQGVVRPAVEDGNTYWVDLDFDRYGAPSSFGETTITRVVDAIRNEQIVPRDVVA